MIFYYDLALLVSDTDVKKIEKKPHLEKELGHVCDWLISNLSIHPGKTESILFDSKKRIKQNSELNIICNGAKSAIKIFGDISWSRN